MPATGEEHAPLSRGRRWAFGIYFILLGLAVLWALLAVWPGTTPPAEKERVRFYPLPIPDLEIQLETRYLLISIFCGALGSYVHAATSFADFAGNRRLFASWGWWYALRPLIGVSLALTFYFVLRAGLISPSAGASTISPYGVAAIAGMAGMFSKQATDKLREVFETLFKLEKEPDRTDRLKE